jgi:SAM-dependent methyltransferase
MIDMTEYETLFSKRAESYLAALRLCPTAMDEEFAAAVHACNLRDGDTLLCIPSAVEDLRVHLYSTGMHIRHLTFETSADLAAATGTPCAKLNAIPVPDNSVDKVLSLASLHHATDEERVAFYVESRRILKHGGALVIGDVAAGSRQDIWLNTFVNAHSSHGHAGRFWHEDADKPLLEAQGFKVTTHRASYNWNFPSQLVMVEYCKRLFCLDLASNEEIQEGLQTILNATETSFAWGLVYFTSTVDPEYTLP